MSQVSTHEVQCGGETTYYGTFTSRIGNIAVVTGPRDSEADARNDASNWVKGASGEQGHFKWILLEDCGGKLPAGLEWVNDKCWKKSNFHVVAQINRLGDLMLVVEK